MLVVSVPGCPKTIDSVCVLELEPETREPDDGLGPLNFTSDQLGPIFPLQATINCTWWESESMGGSNEFSAAVSWLRTVRSCETMLDVIVLSYELS